MQDRLAVDYPVAKQPKHIYNGTARRHMVYTLSGQKYFNTFKLCHMVEICMPLKLFVLKITSNVLRVFTGRFP